MRGSSRRGSREDEYLHAWESKSCNLSIEYRTSDQKTLQEEIKELREFFLSNLEGKGCEVRQIGCLTSQSTICQSYMWRLEAKGRPRSLSPRKGCFKCRDKSHFHWDCPKTVGQQMQVFLMRETGHILRRIVHKKERIDKIYQEQITKLMMEMSPVSRIGKKLVDGQSQFQLKWRWDRSNRWHGCLWFCLIEGIR